MKATREMVKAAQDAIEDSLRAGGQLDSRMLAELAVAAAMNKLNEAMDRDMAIKP